MPTIMVVEDDEAFGYATAKHLERAGYDVVLADGTMSALKVLDAGRQIDLLLVDVAMPKGQPHGLAFARMAQARRPGMKTAFMTAFRDLGIEESEAGAVFYKPIDLDFLTTTIDGLFRDAKSPPERAAD